MGKLLRFTSHSYLDTIDLKMLEKTLISPFDSSLLQDKDKDPPPTTSIHEIIREQWKLYPANTHKKGWGCTGRENSEMAPLPVPRWVVFNICSQARSIRRPWNFPKSKFWSPTLDLLDQKLWEEDPTVPVLTRRFWDTLKFGENRPRTRYGWGDRGMKNKSGHRVAVHHITWERIIVNWRPAQLVSHFKLPVN